MLYSLAISFETYGSDASTTAPKTESLNEDFLDLPDDSLLNVYCTDTTEILPILKGTPNPPSYPQEAKNEAVTGYVTLSWTVGIKGKAIRVKIIEEVPTGYGFAQEAVKYLRELSFQPATRKNKPVPCRVKQKIEWN